MSEEEITQKFSRMMFLKILKRRSRYVEKGWMTMDVKRFIFLLKQELKELEEEIEKKYDKGIMDEAVDVANYAMFIWAKTNEDIV